MATDSASRRRGHEGEDLHRRQVEPLLVVHHAQQWSIFGDVGQQAQHGQCDQEPVGWRARADAERRPQGIALRRGQTIEGLEHWRAQLVQRGEGQLHLRLDANGAHDPTVRRARRQVVQQRGLADAGFAVDDERSALTGSKGFDELIEHAAFGAASDQFHREPPFVAGPRRSTELTVYLRVPPSTPSRSRNEFACRAHVLGRSLTTASHLPDGDGGPVRSNIKGAAFLSRRTPGSAAPRTDAKGSSPWTFRRPTPQSCSSTHRMMC